MLSGREMFEDAPRDRDTLHSSFLLVMCVCNERVETELERLGTVKLGDWVRQIHHPPIC